MQDPAKPCGTAHNAAFPDSKPPQLLRIYYQGMSFDTTKHREMRTYGFAPPFELPLNITVPHKTADEMADAYNFTVDQRAQLAELLAEENRSMWSSALYGIGVGDGEIVVVAPSQLGNVRGQPY